MEPIEQLHEPSETISEPSSNHQSPPLSSRSVKSTISAALPTELAEYQILLEQIPSKAQIFVDEQNDTLDVVQAPNLDDEALGVYDYFQSCSENDFYPKKEILDQLRAGKTNLVSLSNLGVKGAMALAPILPRFSEIKIENANLGPFGLIEIVSGLIQCTRDEILTEVESTEKSAQNNLKTLEIINSSLFSTGQILSSIMPGMSQNELDSALKVKGAPVTEENPMKSTALLSFNSNLTRPFKPPVSIDKGKKPEVVDEVQLGNVQQLPQKLKNYNLRNSYVSGICLQKLIITSKTLVSLNLANNDLGDQNLLFLAKYLDQSQISHLNLSGNNLTDNFLFNIQQSLINSVISNLNLSNNKFSASGAVVFSAFLSEGNRYLEVLNFSNNNIGDVGVCFLIANFCGVGFANKEVFNEGQKAVYQAFQGKSVQGVFKKLPNAGNGDLKSLNISRCGFNVIGAVQIVHLLNNVGSIECLDISGNFYSDIGWYAIMKALSQRGLKAGKIGTIRVQWHVFREEMIQMAENEPTIEELLQKVQEIDKSKIENLEVVE